MLGLRVLEPHRDGCPHMHAMLYVTPMHPRGLCGPPTERQAIAEGIRAIRRAARAVCPGPRGSHLTVIDRARARPSTYLMTYLLKTLPGTARATAGEDDGAEDRHLENHGAVRAWASERRLRRYALLGVHGVQSIWQRLIRASDEEVAGAPEPVHRAMAAMRERRWADALEALGAVRRPGEARPIRLAYETETVIRTPACILTGKPATEERIPLTSAYGDPIRRPAAVVCPAVPEWRLPLRPRGPARMVRAAEQAGKSSSFRGLTVVESCPRAGASPPPSTAWETPDRVIGRLGEAKGRGLQPRGPPQATQDTPEKSTVLAAA